MACKVAGFGAYPTPKMLKIPEDAHSKGMSTFVKVEHLRAEHPRTILPYRVCVLLPDISV
jgi:hypothetical protein